MARLRITVLLLPFILLLAGASFSRSQKAASNAVPDFEVEGIGLTMCQCTAYACPCRSNAHPTHGSCDAADFAYIKRGHFGNVKLDGLKAVIIGDLIDVNPERMGASIYFDEKTTPAQREAFTNMFKFMFQFAPPKIDKTKIVPIEFRESADKTEYSLNIAGILEEKGVMKRDKNGKPVSNLPAMDQWGNAIHYVDNVVFKYHDKGVGEWDLSGHQANVKEFHTTKEMYAQKKLLMQHGDMSGTWNAEQKKIIQEMGMKAE